MGAVPQARVLTHSNLWRRTGAPDDAFFRALSHPARRPSEGAPGRVLKSLFGGTSASLRGILGWAK
eukprot:13204460-Alexandrium_andersonii.AAC.1